MLKKELSREVSRQWRRGFDRDGHYVLKDQSHAHVREEGFRYLIVMVSAY